MIKGAIGIVGLGVVIWTVGCGTHSGIGNLGTGGNGGEIAGMGGQIAGIGGQGVGIGGEPGLGGQGVGIGGEPGLGGQGFGGEIVGLGGQRGSCPGMPSPIGTAKPLAFAAPADYDTGAGAFAVTTGDLNGDGKLDLVLLDNSVGIRVMLNKGDGTFNGPANLGLGGTGKLAVGDVDGDGKADIVQLSQFGVAVMLNKGNASFAPPVYYVAGYGSMALALGDLNGDGKLDIAVADQGSFNSNTGNAGDVGILLNTGGGTFVAANYPASQSPAAIAIGDLDGDCHPDLVVVGNDGVTVLNSAFGNSAGLFSGPRTFGNGTFGSEVALADLNGDGKLDIVEGFDGGSNVLINNGNAFNAPIVYAVACTTISQNAPSARQPLAVADLNGDGRPELLNLDSYCGDLGIFANRGDGTFPASVNFPTVPPTAVHIAAGDLNGDGKPDIAMVSANLDGSMSRLRVLINVSN